MVFQNFISCAAFLSSLSILCITLLHWLKCLEVVSVDESTTRCHFKTQRSLSVLHTFTFRVDESTMRCHFKTQRSLSVLHAFTFRPFFPSEKCSLISIITTVSFVSIRRQRNLSARLSFHLQQTNYHMAPRALS